MRKENQGAVVLDLGPVFTAKLAKIIETKRVPLEARDIIPRVTDFYNLSLSDRSIEWVEYNFSGEAIVTDLKPNTVPVLVAGTGAKRSALKYITAGVRVTANDKQEIADGKKNPMMDIQKSYRIVAEAENNLLMNGFTALGITGVNGLAEGGIHTVAATKPWATATGEEILEDIRKMRAAMVTGKKFAARTLALPQTLDLLLDKQYTHSDAGNTVVSDKTTREVLMSRMYFDDYKSIVGLQSPLGLDNIEENMGFAEVMGLRISDFYTEGRSEIYPVEEKISEFMLFQPEAVVKLTGAI